MSGGVRDNKAASRYELEVDGQTAYAVYEIDGDTVGITHTVVPPSLEGHGVGSRLIEAALADIRAQGKQVEPYCAFVRAYIDKHPEWRELVA